MLTCRPLFSPPPCHVQGTVGAPLFKKTLPVRAQRSTSLDIGAAKITAAPNILWAGLFAEAFPAAAIVGSGLHLGEPDR